MEKKQFIQLYLNKKLTLKEVANIMDCSTATIITMAKRFELPPRKMGRPMKIKQ